MSLKLPRHWDFSTLKAETVRIARTKSVMPGEGNAGPGSIRSPRSMERPLKAGWLKKQQRGLVKNWHQRYFVLRGSSLTQHKDDKETAIQAVIHIRHSKVNELPLNSDDLGKYLFEIVPRSTVDRDVCPYVFMANSQADMEEWVRALRRVTGVPNGVFGKSLMDTVTYEQRFGPRTVPILVQKCVEFIQEHGLIEEGIFRLPGQDNAVKQFREAFDAGERPSFPSDTDVHTVASLLKLYLRELPEPVVPWTQYQDFLDCTSIWDCNNTEALQKLEQQIALLPRTNYDLLSYICRFLFEVQLKSAVNKMNVENLATVMGINLLKPQLEDPITVMKATPLIQKLMTVMIRQHQTLFPPSKDVLLCPPSSKTENQKNTPRSFVGWESAEMGETSLSESPGEEEEEEDSPQIRPASPSSDLWHGSPRKRTQTLPTFSCPLTGMAAKAGALNRWGRIQESSEEKSGTLSEDIFKILDLQGSGSLFGRSTIKTQEGGGTLATQTGGDDVGSSSAGSSSAGSSSAGSSSTGSSSAGSSSAGSSSTGSSSAGSRDATGDDQARSATSPQEGVTELLKSGSAGQVKSKSEQKNGEQQPAERLQQENAELRAKVAELQSALADYHRRVAALEIHLRNAERSRDEAQRRKEELQRDLQQFLTSRPQAPT